MDSYTSQTIEASEGAITSVDLLGHSYFARTKALLNDIFNVMRGGEPPARLQRIEALQDGESRLWKLVR